MNPIAAILAGYGHGSGHVFNLGHGITPDVPVHAMETFVRTVQTFRYDGCE